jgi:peptide/nickel transport system substrate-binding protein
VRIQHISIKIIPDVTTNEALALRAGEVDLALDLASANVSAFESTSGVKVSAAPACLQTFFGMNVTRPPWNNVHVRRAVAYAVNRADVIAAVGHVFPNTTLIPSIQLRTLGSQSAVNTLLKSLPNYPFNLTKAKQELAQSPYPQGFTATLPAPQFGVLPNIAQVIAGDLAKVGINLELKSISSTAWLADIFGDHNDIGMEIIQSGCNSPDPSFYMSRYVGSKRALTGGLNFTQYTPSEMDDLVVKGLSTADRAKRLAVYGDILKRLATDVPYMPLFVSPASYALSSKFTWNGFHAFERQSGPWALDITQK